MTIASIIADFESRGVYLWADQGNLKFKAPAGVMTAALKTQLQDNKAALIDYLSDPVMAAIEPNYADRYQPFPLTDLQVAYLVGRNNAVEYGGVGCHSYIELDLPNIDAKRLQTAWHKLVERHDMLRAIINLDGTQQIIAQVTPKAIRVHEFVALDQQTRQQKLLGLREQLLTATINRINGHNMTYTLAKPVKGQFYIFLSTCLSPILLAFKLCSPSSVNYITIQSVLLRLWGFRTEILLSHAKPC